MGLERWSDDLDRLHESVAHRFRKKVALTACMRKLLTILGAMLRKRARWAPMPPLVT